jgi:uncharacterized protein YggE
MKTMSLVAFFSAALVWQLHSAPDNAEPELKGRPSELAGYLAGLPPTVSISGEGEVKAQADRAILTFKVTTDAKLLHDAVQANQELRRKMAEFLKEHGVEPARIQAGRFSSTEKHGTFSDKVKGYRVENLVKVTVLNEQEFQSAAEISARFPDVTYLNVEFEHSDKEKLKTTAASQACENAERRKQMFEQKLGLRLSPRRFFDAYPQVSNNRFITGVAGGTAPSFVTGTFSSPADIEARESATAFGELVFRAHVTIEYIVEKNR